MSNLPYPVRYKLPLQYLSVDDWNNFVNDLLFILQYGPGKWLQYYDNGNMSNINVVRAKTGNFTDLEANGYQALWNLKPVETYTFPYVFENWLNDLQNAIPEFNEILNEIPNVKIPTYPAKTIPEPWLTVLKQFVYTTIRFQSVLSRFKYKLYTAYLETFPSTKIVSGLQATVSGSVNLASLVPAPLANSVRYAILRNIGTVPIQVNGGIYLMPGDTLRAKIVDITVKSLNEITLTSSQPVPVGMIMGISALPTYAITIQNSQSDPTPAPFQVLLNLNLQGIISSPSGLLSLLFCQDTQCTQPLYAWVESYSSNLSSVNTWVLLPKGIPASSSMTIYMQVNGRNNYPYTGIAPQLTSVYAQYDNGDNVFTFYDNFAGTSLNTNKWTANGASYSVDNGLTYNTNANNNVLTSLQSFTDPYVIDWYGYATAGESDTGIYFNVQSTSANSNANLWAQRGSSVAGGEDMYYTYISGSYTNYGEWQYTIDGNFHVYTLMVGPSNDPLISQKDYSTVEDYTSFPDTYTSGYFGPRQYYSGSIQFWQWVRVRAYPPNGVTPSLVSFVKIS